MVEDIVIDIDDVDISDTIMADMNDIFKKMKSSSVDPWLFVGNYSDTLVTYGKCSRVDMIAFISALIDKFDIGLQELVVMIALLRRYD